ncbi:lamin tail domain-containing protein [Algoriphagus kandeliae]|uniref:Lamin tail domain-containing protein n=1 Tax=Algoriphagus kandeliae TaxID=2562278 RepID=A0A4Y9QLC0_9BACT|nr:lamin tail domain-containing protein [Algoriphagus kandeliae]TFV93491.1 lamin tail domain-containing protein [Algoriphagus kandeliae]
MKLFNFIVFLFCVSLAKVAWTQTAKQDFESSFEIQSYPSPFLSGWYGNEVRATSSRIWQTNGSGINRSKALAVQPISTFDGELTIRLNPAEYSETRIRFWARSARNGAGNRPAVVSYSFSNKLDGDFSEEIPLASDDEFANEDQDFRLFQIEFPQDLKFEEEVFLRISIRYGPGSGSCARWFMDDFEFGDWEEDRQSPEVISVRGYSKNQLELSFSEPLDPIFSQIQLNYDLEGFEPSEASLKQDSLVILSFPQGLEEGRNYQLAIRQIPDLAGNFLMETTFNFVFQDPTDIAFKDLVINELMPAPRDENDLPNVEYLELYHQGEKDFRLGGLILANSRTQTELPDYWLSSGEFLILAPESGADLLLEYGNILAVDNWPTLLNSGDEVSLMNSEGELIDQISYSTASWGGSEFSGGGYSLEVVNPNLLCNQATFLKPSINPKRGTPGMENSVLDLSPDEEAPQISGYFFLDERQLVVEFSETIQTRFEADFLEFNPFLELDSVWIKANSLFIKIKDEFPENQSIELRLSSISDCSGNNISPQVFEIVRPKIAEKGEVFLNELLFNPISGSPKFVELVNATDLYLEVGAWSLANLDDQGAVNQNRKLSDASLVMPPRSFLAITTDPARLKLDYPKSSQGLFHQISSLPSFPISGGTVVLLDVFDQKVEEFTYSEDLHHPLLRNPKGVSLERVSVDSPADFSGNWHSASGTEEYATPGRENSQQIPDEFSGELIQIDPEIFDPEGSNGNTFTTIRYQVDQAGWVGTFRIYDIAGRLIQVLAQNEILGREGLYTWTGVDSQGKRLRPGYYILLVELFDLEGRIQTIKKTIVIAERI